MGDFLSILLFYIRPHRVKNVQIWSFFLVRIQSECGKIRTRKNSVFGHFSRSALYLDTLDNACSFLLFGGAFGYYYQSLLYLRYLDLQL